MEVPHPLFPRAATLFWGIEIQPLQRVNKVGEKCWVFVIDEIQYTSDIRALSPDGAP